MADFVTLGTKTIGAYSNTRGGTPITFDIIFDAAQINEHTINGAQIDLVYQYDRAIYSIVASPKFINADDQESPVWNQIFPNLSKKDVTSPIGTITLVATFDALNPITPNGGASGGKVLTVTIYVTGDATNFDIMLQKIAVSGENYITVDDGTLSGAKYFLDGGELVIPPASLADVVVDLMPGSDSGILATDDITNVTTPAVTVNLTGKSLTEGHILKIIDTSNSNAVVGTYTITAQDASGLASKDITLSTLSGGAHALKAQFSTSSGTLGTPSTTATTVTVDTTVPTTTISALTLSADTGTSGTDYITNNASQTISGTLSGVTVAGEVVRVSTDNGTTWTTATNPIGQNSFSLPGVTLTGSNTLKVQVEDAAGNAGTATSQTYVLDTLAPTVSISSNASSVKVGETATITFTFSEDPGTTFLAGDIITTDRKSTRLNSSH